MPYLTPDQKAELKEKPYLAKDFGDYNYLFTVAILTVWNAMPRYETIHKLAQATDNFFMPMFSLPEIDAVAKLLQGLGVPDTTTLKAAQLAFLEFYIRIGQHYEREKRDEQGDLDEYKTAIEHLNKMAQANFNRRIGVK